MRRLLPVLIWAAAILFGLVSIAPIAYLIASTPPPLNEFTVTHHNSQRHLALLGCPPVTAAFFDLEEFNWFIRLIRFF